ncbi:MAG TPA: response regulator transcription factor [Candidatus Limnocylindria bacterium]|nr:response regulator transcription factor [Candidatus Limnocylindria bacterium]
MLAVSTGGDERPILVVDDDPKIVHLVRTYLEREGHRVTAAHDGRSALASMALDPPALVVLDLMLPEVDGISVLRAIRRRDATPVVVLSARGTARDRVEGLEEGADDYVPKPFSPAELVLRIRRLLRTPDPRPQTHEPIRHGALVVDRDRRRVTVDGAPVELTRIEMELLLALLDADGRVLTRDQLLDAVHGRGEAFVLDRTVDAHIKRLRAKLSDDPDAPRFVATVRGVGYRAVEADEGRTP